jgi:hypothetical protein
MASANRGDAEGHERYEGGFLRAAGELVVPDLARLHALALSQPPDLFAWLGLARACRWSVRGVKRGRSSSMATRLALYSKYQLKTSCLKNLAIT